jgi:N-acetylneuraminic acid mutarotase
MHYTTDSWKDSSGNVWMFGGYGRDSTDAYGELNDLWKFDGTDWTWVGGSNLANQSGVYGALGVADPANIPGGRDTYAIWQDSYGNVWLFGGEGFDSLGNGSDEMNDLWMFDGANWTWMSGPSVISHTSSVFGTQGVASSSNIPPGKWGGQSWIDSAGNLWLFGGYGYDSLGNGPSEINDFWKFDY